MSGRSGSDSARSGSDRPRSGSRAHELLASLDAAKRQKVQNEKRRHMVLDAEELLQKLLGQLCCARSKTEVERAQQRSAELIKEFDDAISYTHLTKFNVSRYMTDCAQEMQVRELFRHEDHPEIGPLNSMTATLQDMRGRGASAEYFTPTIDMALHALSKVHSLIGGSQLQAGEWAGCIQPLMLLLREVMNRQPVECCLTELNEQVERLKFTMEEVQQEQADAVDKGDMGVSEQLYYKKITIQEALADTITKKFDLIDAEEEVLFRAPLRKVHEVHGSVNKAISDILHQKETLKKRCEKDLANLNREVERVNLEDYNATQSHAAALDKVTWAMKENQLQQDLCWQKMQQLEKELVSLGEQRHAHITEHIRLIEDDERRKVEYQHFMEFVNQHKSLLELSVHNCEIAEEVTDGFDEVVSGGCNAIERRMREVEKEIEDLRIAVHEEYLSQFRGMYLTLGDLQYKKEANIAALEEKMEHARMQQEMMMESLNPKAKEYSALRKDLAKTKEDLEVQVNTLREKSVLYIEAFEPTKQALLHAGKDFKHPVDELSSMNEQRRNKLVAYHQLLEEEAAGAQGDLDAEREQIDLLRLTYASQPRGSPRQDTEMAPA